MTASRSAKRTALVTGASTGIGAEFARQLARRGHDLVLVSRRSEALRDLGANLEGTYGVEVRPLPADLTDPAALERVAARVEARDDPIDVVVNNAGVGGGGPLARQDLTDIQASIDLNVRAVVRLTHAAMSSMRRRRATGGPRGVINISSMAGALPAMPGNAVYAAGKAFVRSFTESVALEETSHGLRATAVLPGYVRTPMTVGLQAADPPDVVWVSAERVVTESLRAFAAGRTHVVPGYQYKIADVLLGVVPGAVVRRGVLAAMRRLR
ncbi:SDR family NAD(P)-dependent oxidoreductase [Spiractinospora alimapuensis]|uniref:SDR family NAD(P)-dependent oxidoreductase n=1 Tax=Spiractinospora alimapuensis TaxID=2820884 RepID=UPI001F3642C5|nr:SDR family NAD(P)-dependent oxidoreductase [Spiractinospora alimapuensis]QVQ50337.1 SDR family NAD(P)-dependent oxidoreductase [Spiractinospora alimapuensis]